MYLMKTSQPCRNFVDHAYKEEVIVKDGYALVKYDETKGWLLVQGFKLIKEVPDGTKYEDIPALFTKDTKTPKVVPEPKPKTVQSDLFSDEDAGL